VEAKKFLCIFCWFSGLYPNPASSKTHLCLPNIISKLFLPRVNLARAIFKSSIYSLNLSQHSHEGDVLLFPCIKHFVENWFLSTDFKIFTSDLRFSNSKFNFKISFSKLEIVYLEYETNLESLIDSLYKSFNASWSSSKEIDKS